MFIDAGIKDRLETSFIDAGIKDRLETSLIDAKYLPADNAEMPHAAGAGGLPPLGLHGPVVLADLGSGESTSGADLLLDVEGSLK